MQAPSTICMSVQSEYTVSLDRHLRHLHAFEFQQSAHCSPILYRISVTLDPLSDMLPQ